MFEPIYVSFKFCFIIVIFVFSWLNEFSIFNDENLNREYERILKENHMCDTLLISAKLNNS